MAEIKTGVFPVHALDFKVNTGGRTTEGSGSGNYVTVADTEDVTMKIDGKVEKWDPIEMKGWQRALNTGKSLSFSCKGKRNFGDAGNDYIASMFDKTGQDCNTTVQLTFPNGDKYEIPVVIDLKSNFVGKSTEVGSLDYDLISDGKPTFTKAGA